MHDQPLMLALVAVQFMVHAIGWSMTARLFKGWRGPEGQFAAAWLALSAGLLLYVPPLASGHLLRNLGDLLIVGSAVMQHRGMALHWRQAPPDRAGGGLLVATASVVLASLYQQGGHGWRVAAVCAGVAVMLLATAFLVWRHGRDTFPLFARLVGAGYALMSIVLLARAAQAMAVGASSKISIDAPRTSNVFLVMLVMLIGGLMNLVQVRLVLGNVLARLMAQAYTDQLTGVSNRRGLLRSIERTHERATRGDSGYVVLMVDVDHFKSINDLHGHEGAGRVLTGSARQAQEAAETAERLLAQQDLEQQQAALARKREALVSQIATLQAEFAATEAEAQRAIRQSELRMERQTQDRQAMGFSRREDVAGQGKARVRGKPASKGEKP